MRSGDGGGKDRGAAEGGDSSQESQAGAEKSALANQQVSVPLKVIK